MNPLKPSDYIYFKIPKYLKEHFLPLYERLLYDTTEQFLNTTYTSNKDSNVHLHSSTYFKININVYENNAMTLIGIALNQYILIRYKIFKKNIYFEEELIFLQSLVYSSLYLALQFFSAIF